MRRITPHWSAEGHKANATDKRHYRFIPTGAYLIRQLDAGCGR